VNDKELEEVLGTIGFREYNAAPEHAREEVREFAATVRELSDAEFVLNAAYRIEESARWGSVRGTHWNGIHAMASGCYTESQRRLEAEGHAEDCNASSLYVEAYNKVARANRLSGNTFYPCTCGARSEK
jgi:hypothetical protein